MQPNKEKRDKTIAERQRREQSHLLEKLNKMPILQIALEQTNISRSTYYRWRDENNEFKALADKATAEGEAFITELSESKLISLIGKEHFPAIQAWLKAHHPKYSNKLELSGTLDIRDEALTLEQQAVIKEALRLAGVELSINQGSYVESNTQPTS